MAVSRVHPRQQKFRAMNGAHLARPIRGELGYAHRPWLGSQIHCPIGNQIWGPLGKEYVCPNFALTLGKFVFSNSGNFRAKAIHQSPGLALNAHSGNDWGPIPVLTGSISQKKFLNSSRLFSPFVLSRASHNRNRKFQTSKEPLKSQAQGTSLFTNLFRGQYWVRYSTFYTRLICP